ncbi:MAG: ComEC/Rec2 family competence protein, partial [Pseudomonadota bacterium]
GTVLSAHWRGPREARLVIAVHVVEGVASDERPVRVRLTRRGIDALPQAGDVITIRAMLLPPPDAAIPGGFDFRRSAYLDRIGAVGYALANPIVVQPADQSLDRGIRDMLERLRVAIAEDLRVAAPAGTGDISAALIVGLRDGIDDTVTQNLRDTGLAHILAISGLHMALFAGTLFALVRVGLAAVPGVGVRWPVKKLAASIALVGAVAYLGLSGAGIATQRAFIMATIMLVAVLIERPALTMRNVAVAAMIVMILSPGAVLSASFQMSFAAVAALIAAYREVQARALHGERGRRAPSPALLMGRAAWRYVFALSLTSLVAGLATSLFAVYHFGRFPAYQLIANLVAMPVFGTLVMPPAVATLLCLPLGLEAIPLKVMGLGIDLVTGIAAAIAAWPGARIGLSDIAMPIMVGVSLGAWLWFIGQGVIRFAGIAIVSIGLVLSPVLNASPIGFIDREAGLIAADTETGWSFAGVRRSGFVIEAVLRSRGDARDPGDIAFDRCKDSVCTLDTVSGHSIGLFDAMPEPDQACHVDVAVLRGRPNRPCPDAILVLDWDDIDRHGASYIYETANGGLMLRGARDRQSTRPWSLQR